MKKPTIQKIATEAGVGTATVERVLNARGGVSVKTAQKVILAATQLDWPGRLPELHRGILKIEVVMVRPETSFFRRLADAFHQISIRLDHSLQIQVVFLDESNPETIAQYLSNPESNRSGLVISSTDHPSVTKAVMKLKAEALPMVQIVTRFLDGIEYVGIDNYSVGRTAGRMMHLHSTQPGRVIALSNGASYQVHRERIRGFSDYIREHAANELSFDFVAFGSDSASENQKRIRNQPAHGQPLVGIYNAGGGMSGVVEELNGFDGRVSVIGHELNDYTSSALRDEKIDVIFDQIPELQAQRAIDILLSKLGVAYSTVDNSPIRFSTITKESL